MCDVRDNVFFSQAVTKMSHKVESGQKTTCILEIGDKGIKMVDKSKPGVKLILLTLHFKFSFFLFRTVMESLAMNTFLVLKMSLFVDFTQETTDILGLLPRYSCIILHNLLTISMTNCWEGK